MLHVTKINVWNVSQARQLIRLRLSSQEPETQTRRHGYTRSQGGAGPAHTAASPTGGRDPPRSHRQTDRRMALMLAEGDE